MCLHRHPCYFCGGGHNGLSCRSPQPRDLLVFMHAWRYCVDLNDAHAATTTVPRALFDETCERKLLGTLDKAAELQFECDRLHAELDEVRGHLASADAEVIRLDALCVLAHAEAVDPSAVPLESVDNDAIRKPAPTSFVLLKPHAPSLQLGHAGRLG